MKKSTAILLLLALILTSQLNLSGYASPTADAGDGSTVTDSTVTEPTPDPVVDPDAETVDPPLTEGTGSEEPTPPTTTPPVTEPPVTTPPVNEPPITEPPLTEPPITEPPITEPPVTEPAPSDEELLYDALAAVIDAGEASLEFSTSEKLSDDLIRYACVRALERTPRFFYLNGIDVVITPLSEPDETGNLYVYQIIPDYRFAPGEELDTAKAFVKAETDKIIAAIPEGIGDLEKILFLHDYLCTHFAYDGVHSDSNLYLILEHGHGVCQAYVYLYAYLLDALSIPNDFAISQEMNHIWNLVQVEGEWYHVDLTWDDPATDQPGRALHTNFLRSDKGIAETGHINWEAPYVCSSDLYEKSFLYDLTGAVLFTPYGAYGLSISQRHLMRLDFNLLDATPMADLTQLRWPVWEKPGSLWKEQYVNLYSDGFMIYFNGPDTIWSFDPELEELALLHTFDPSKGYLYSLSGEGHQLTCTISTEPGAMDGTVLFTTPHVYRSEGGFFFSTHTCVVCDHSEAYLSPRHDDFITACLSVRMGSEFSHDLRLLLLVDQEMLEESPPLTVRLTLNSVYGERSVTTVISEKDFGLFLVYDKVNAGGRDYGVAYGYDMLGLIIRSLENGSYDSVTVTVMAEEIEIYSSTISASLLFPSPDLPPVTGEVPTTGEIPTTGEVPITGEIPTTGETPVIETPPATAETPAKDEITDPIPQ
ncbi:MAG: hypothetical protein IJW98_05080 [Clostridia bacterium]|nr:hypothetical protein [Clostridia bacterium]